MSGFDPLRTFAPDFATAKWSIRRNRTGVAEITRNGLENLAVAQADFQRFDMLFRQDSAVTP
jgi:hypothetical protein